MHQFGIQIFRLLILAQVFGCDALYPITEVFDIHRHFLIFGKDKRSITLGMRNADMITTEQWLASLVVGNVTCMRKQALGSPVRHEHLIH